MRNLRIPQVFTLIPNVVQVYKIKIATTCYPDNCDLISYSKRVHNHTIIRKQENIKELYNTNFQYIIKYSICT